MTGETTISADWILFCAISCLCGRRSKANER